MTDDILTTVCNLEGPHNEAGPSTVRITTRDMVDRIIIHGPKNKDGFHDMCLIRFDEDGNAYLWREGDES